ncbi:MAG: hypothetical protein P4L33_18220 [Capsulimonadaceae bacterium]|nr:hypothetical protein [Capsulimonadaceae bacterium]
MTYAPPASDGKIRFEWISEAWELFQQTLMPQMWRATGLWFVLALISAVGALCCFVGLLVALPVVSLTVGLLARNVFGVPAAPTQPRYEGAPGAWPAAPEPPPAAPPADKPAEPGQTDEKAD